MAGLPKALSAALLSAALAIAIAGCGSGSSTTTASPEASTPSATTPAPSGEASAQTSTPTTPTTTQGSSGEASGSSSSPDNSIQTYGSAADSAQKTAIAAAAFSFFKAIAASDYAKVCSGLSASNRGQLKNYLKLGKSKARNCPTLLATLLRSGAPEARKAAAGTLTAVRVKGDTAFVLFRPKGGKASYFVLKREAGAWKAISLAPGAPLYP